MYNKELFILNKKIKLSELNRYFKLFRWHLVKSKVLELYCKMSNRTLEKKIKTFWEDDYFVILPEGVSTTIYRYGYFEADLSKLFMKYVKQNMVVIDIGAHFGYYSILSSWLIGCNGKVISFEPTPSTYQVLKRNTENKNNIFINNLAVYSSKCTVNITDYGVESSAFNTLGIGNLPIDKKSINSKSVLVNAISLDEYLDSHDGIIPNFIKIDAEGAELEILRGMKKTLINAAPLITLEVGDINSDIESNSRKLIQHMLDYNYQCFEYKNDQLIEHKLKEKYNHDNLFFIPKSKL